jgi:hypothetical protein
MWTFIHSSENNILRGQKTIYASVKILVIEYLENK